MKININKAGNYGLQDIIHVGHITAGRIIAHRRQHKFKDIHELSFVKGIGTKKMADIIEQGIVEV